MQVTVDDGDGGSATASTMVVVYDPTAGRVVGGGHVPARRPRGLHGHRAVLRLDSRRLTAVRLPGGARFASTSIQWLVVTGFKSQFRGVGRINGTGDYGFLLTAYDGQQAGGGGVDRFRIRNWNRSGAVVYDNVLDPTATDDIDRAKPQAVGFGTAITIFKF